MKLKNCFVIPTLLLGFLVSCGDDSDSSVNVELSAEESSSSDSLTEKTFNENNDKNKVVEKDEQIINSSASKDESTESNFGDKDDEENPNANVVFDDLWGTCSATQTSVFKNQPVTWKFTRNPSLLSMGDILNAKFQWTSEGYESEIIEGINGTTQDFIYKTMGAKNAFITVSLDDEKHSIQCGNKVSVIGSKISGCTCTADKNKLDLATEGYTATWQVLGCESDVEIIKYEWKEADGTDSKATYTFKKNLFTVQPSVTIYNADKNQMTALCTSVKSFNSNKPEYILDNLEYIDIPEGVSKVGIKSWEKNEYMTHKCKISCRFNISYNDPVNIEISVDEYSASEEVYYNLLELALPPEYCEPENEFELKLSAAGSCYFSQW